MQSTWSRFFAEIRSLPSAIRLFFAVAASLDLLAFGCEFIGRRRHLGLPYDSPVLNEAIGVDLTNFLPVFRGIHTLRFFSDTSVIPYMYPAPVAPLYGFFGSLPHPVVWFEATLCLVIVSVAALFARSLHRAGISALLSGLLAAATVVLSYPIWFELRQGNMELFVCVLLGAAVLFFLNDRPHLAAILIGLAGSMKIFPLVYLGLFIARRRYKPLLTAAASAIVATVLSLLYIYPSISVSWRGVQKNIAYYTVSTVLVVRREMGYDHSLFAIAKLLSIALRGVHSVMHFAALFDIYLAIVALLGLAIFFLRIRCMPVLNQVLCLCVVSILVPPVSFDYTLTHLYIPWILLVFFAIENRDRTVPGLKLAFLSLAVATAAETEVIFRATTYGGQVKAIFLTLLFILAVRFKFPTPTPSPRR